MNRLTFTAALLLFTGTAWASCKTDIGGTFKTQQPELNTVSAVMCRGCREVNHHPQDIRNFMWNWVVLGRGGTLTPGTGSLGRYIFGFRLNQRFEVTPLWGDSPGSNVLSVPVANDHGQAATGTVEVVHNLIGIYTTHGFRIGIVTGIREIKVTVTRGNGSQISATYPVSMMQAHLARKGYRLPVPADTRRDFAGDGDCLNNLGQPRPPDSEMRPPSGGSSGEAGDDPYQRWWDEEEAYGGRVPEYLCGFSPPTPGGATVGTRTCGWFWF